jgi:hypothetical protein
MTWQEQGIERLSHRWKSPDPSASIQVWSLQAIGFTSACLEMGFSSVDCRVITPFCRFLLLLYMTAIAVSHRLSLERGKV